MESNTPRTDRVVTGGNPAGIQRFADLLEHARSLERELAAMHELYVEGSSMKDDYKCRTERDVQDSIDKHNASVMKLEREHRRMKHALLEIEKFAAGTLPGSSALDRIADMARTGWTGDGGK